jgi:hypothetical protein
VDFLRIAGEIIMTKPVNFPGRKYIRRMVALSALEKRMGEKPTFSQMQEHKALVERTKGGGGKRSTKKVGANTGMKFSGG